MKTKKEGDPVTGKVTKKIKGGLLVDIGVNVFLPASQVDIRRPGDIGDYIGRDDRARDPQDRRRAPQHRRQPPQADREQREELKKKTLDGTRGRPDRQGHRQEHRRLRRVRRPRRHRRPAAHHRHVLGPHQPPAARWSRSTRRSRSRSCTIDKDKEKIALGLKQKDASPWENIETKYPVGTRARRRSRQHHVATARSCKLEEGIEGLVHISEMSWTKRINHPSELVAQRREGRGRGPGDQQGQAGNLARHEADRGEPLGPRRREVPARHGRQRQGPQPHQLRRVRRDRRRHRRPAARLRHVVDQEDRPPVAKCSRRAKTSRRSCSASTRRSSASRWA